MRLIFGYFKPFFYRYRLFGNSLEIASRLNNIGKANKIHISLDTKQLLDSIGGFCMEYRGVFDTLVGSSLRHYKFHIYDDNKSFSYSQGFNFFFNFYNSPNINPGLIPTGFWKRKEMMFPIGTLAPRRKTKQT